MLRCASAPKRWHLLAATVVLLASCWALVAQASARIYWTDFSGSVARSNNDGTGAEPNFIVGGGETAGLAVTGTHIYWANGTGSSIGRANLNGSGPEQSFIAGLPGIQSLAIDEDHLYWTDVGTGTIGRARIDGSEVENEFITGVGSYFGLAVVGEHIYWVNEYNAIGRANIDGSEVEEDFIPSLGGIASYGIYANGDYIYWADDSGTTIGRATIQGTDVEDEFISGLNNPGAIAVDGDYIYFSNTGSETIGRADLDGGAVDSSLVTGAGYALGLATDVSQPTLRSHALPGFVLGTGVIADTAALAGGGGPAGTIGFRLYGPNDSTCVGAPAFTTTVKVKGNGSYVSPAFTPTRVGTYRWVAAYSGNFGNLPASASCAEPAAAVKVVPSNAFSPLKVTARNKVKGTGKVGVYVAFEGTITLAGSGVKTRTKVVPAAGSYQLNLAPRGSYMKHIERHRRGYTEVTISFAPTGGEPAPAVGLRLRLVKKQEGKVR